MTEISIAELNEIINQSDNVIITNDKTTEGVNWLDDNTLNIYNVTLTGSGQLENKIISADLTGLDVSNIADMANMFWNCSYLTSLDVSNWNTSNVTRMDDMFRGCSSLVSLDLSNFDTSKVTIMNGVFRGCSSLGSVDLSSWNTSKVIVTSGMFEGCTNTRVRIGEDWNLNPASLGGTNITYTLVEKYPKVYLKNIQLATKELTDELYINKDEKGEADGVATLDENGKVPITQLPSALLTYEGTWNAATNTPELSNDTVMESMKGQVYICDTAGTWNEIEFRAGDWIICNGEIWQRSTADDLVKSVNGLIGIVELDGSNVKATYEDETDFINNLLPKLGKVKAVNEQQPDDQGNITVDGDSINVVYEDEEDTLNNTLPKLGKVKTVNEEEPDTEGNITVDGDNINVVYEEVEDTLNNTLPKLGKVKTVDEHEPDEQGNIQLSWVGTKAEWEALDKSQLAGNGIIKLYFTDAENGSVVNVVEAGNMNPVTSNAVSKLTTTRIIEGERLSAMCNVGEETVVGRITLPKGSWFINCGGYSPLGIHEHAATSHIKIGNDWGSIQKLSYVFNFNTAVVLSAETTFEVMVVNWESQPIQTHTNWLIRAYSI